MYIYACAAQSLEDGFVWVKSQLTQYTDEITELKSTVQTLASTVQSLQVSVCLIVVVPFIHT